MEKKWNRIGKRVLSCALTILLAVQAAPAAYGIDTQNGVSNSDTQISSPVEKVYVNSYGGNQRSTDFNQHWKFNLGDAGGAQELDYDDSAWRDVNLPHDYSIEQPYSASNEAESGYLPGGIGWYRKHFTVDPSWQTKRVSINFDGAYMNTEVYLNGIKLGSHPYGYTPFSLELPSDLLNYNSENVIAVKTNNKIPSSRWYSGSGIYRDVTLIATDPVHVAPNGVTVLTPNIENGTGTVKITTKVANDSTAAAQDLTVSHTITEKGSDQEVVSGQGSIASITNGTSQSVDVTVTVPSPKLWNVWDKGAQTLYEVHTEIKKGDQVLDSYDTTFGFRYFKFTQQGFSLNGEKMKLRGVCMHHDQGALGAEAWYRATERQVEILKEMGCNAIRVTHNPASQVLLDICNEQGMLVVEEAFDTWTQQKNYNTNDYSAWFETVIAADNKIEGANPGTMTWAEYDIKAMVERGKNYPCIIMWSLGNEILETTQYDFSKYTQHAQNLINWVKQVDETRPTTFGDNKLKANNATAKRIANVIHRNGGVIGFNYATIQQMTSNSASDWLIYGSETASAINSSGVYNYIGNGGQTGNQRLTSYDTSKVGWGALASEAWYQTITMDRNAGEFVWTGFDYIGEPTPWNGTTGGSQTGNFAVAPKSSYFGIVDTTGFPKDSYYLYQSQWNDQVNTLHILPTWNEEDVLQDNGKVRVVVYSDAAEIKLYLNNKLVGTAQAEKQTTAAGYSYSLFTTGTDTFQPASANHQKLYATFLVPYEEGTLRAEAYDSNGDLIPENQLEGRTQVKTTEEATQLSLSADRTEIQADGKDLSYITIDVTDRNGELVNSAEPTISLSITGDGEIIGVDSGAQFDHTSPQSTTWKAFHGKLLAIVQSTTNDGSFTVTAKADGMVTDSVTVQTTPVAAASTEKTVSSLEYARTYYVKVNNEPVLPSTIKVNYADGTSEQKSVQWSGTGDTTQAGNFTKTGTIDGITTTASVRVVMLDSVAALMNYSCAVAVGAAANLPATRPAITADGQVLDAYFPVEWDSVNTTQPGLYPVQGRASVFGQDMTLTAMVRVSEGEIHKGSNMAPRVVELYHGTESDNGTNALRVICDENTNADQYWSGQGEVRFRYDTAQNINEVKLYLKDTAPSSRDMHVEWSPDGSSWTPIEAEVSNEAGAGMTIRTYSFDIVSAVWMKLVFDAPVNLVEAELNTGIPSFAIGSEAALSSLNVKGRIADQDALSANVFGTPDTDVTLQDVTAVGVDNASITMLPVQDQVIRLVLESEDHSAQSTFQILLGNTSSTVTDASSDELDYDRNKTRASAGSENADNTAHTEGPASYAVDGNESTIWHSNWNAGAGDADLSDNPELRWFMLTLDEATELNALRYLPRSGNQGAANGRIQDYRIEVSTSAQGPWETVAQGRWQNTTGWKIAPFTKTVTAQYVRLWGDTSYGDQANKFLSAAEIRVCKPASDLFTLAEVTLPQEAYDYTGEAITPEPTVTLKSGGAALKKGTDYTVSYANNTEPGIATVTITGAGTYTGIIEKTFTINAVDINIESYVPIEVNTGKGVAPQLPGTVTANMSAGGQRVFEVIWADIDPSRYAKLGEFEVYGTVVGQTLPVTANVVVSGITGVETIALVTMPNVDPTLPMTVKVYLSNGETSTANVEWEEKEYTGSAGDIITVSGTVDGTDLKATATVRLVDMTESATNLAKNTSVNLGSAANGSLPLAIAWVSAGNDNPFRATDGQKSFTSNHSKNIWSDWERGAYHMDQNWLGVIFGSGDTVESQLLHKVSVGFMEEDGTGANKVKLPASYKIEYYVGPEGFAYQTKLSTNQLINQGNGFVRNWDNSNPLKDPNNWREVTYTGNGKPAVPAVGDFKNMVDITFEPVETQIIRISLTPQTNQWVGIEEFEVYGYNPVTLNNSFDVSDIKLDGQNKLGEFSGNTLDVKLEADAPIPVITASATNNASVTVVQAYDRNSTAKVIFKAEDGTGEQTYTINFTADEAALHPIQYQLYHLTADPKPIDVADGQPLEATLKADAEYQLPDAIQVRMGGRVLDVGIGYTYDKASGQVQIASVTGEVVIIADAIQTGSIPTITTTTLDNGKVNTPYSALLAAKGDAPITWRVSSGDLPTGLSLGENGLISGTPKAEGKFTFTVTATNRVGSSSQTLSIQVEKDISSEKEIRSFNIAGGGTTISGTQITVTMPHGTDVTSLIPTIIVSDKASVSPASGEVQNFSKSVMYRVTAEDGSTQDYTVTVEVAAQGIYVISADTVANGIIRTSASSAKEGTEIDVTFEPDSGYAVKEGSLKVYKTGEQATTVPVSNHSFMMPGYGVTVTAEFEAVAPAFVAVKNITGVPVETQVGVALPLSGTVLPSDATNRQIVWRVKQAGSTGASIQNDVLFTTSEGVAILTATIADGQAPGVAYTQDFTIAVTNEAQSYVVEFQTNNGSDGFSQRVKAGEQAKRPADPARAQYSFTGWYLDELCTVAYDFNTPVTKDLKLYAGWRYRGTSSSSDGNQTETERNPDGSTTTIVTKQDGTVTETTKYPDGSREVVQKNPDGSTSTTITQNDGSSSVTKVDKRGQVEAEVKVSQSAVDEAQKNGENVALPMPSVPNTTNRNNAPTITVGLPGSEAVKVEIPVENATPGTVAIVVKADGTEEIIQTTQTTVDGVAVTLNDGDTVKIVDNSKIFDDVPRSFWAHDNITFTTSRELFSGTGENTFSPDVAMTRAMIVTVLARFEDVDTSVGESWYEAGRQWAMENQISDGTNMHQSLTREQLATMLYRYVNEPKVTASLNGFADASKVSDYAQKAMAWAVEQGLISGVGNNLLDPQGQATRAQVATILARFIDKV